jgi:hypothetical protein
MTDHQHGREPSPPLDDSIARIIRDAAPSGFRPGFSERVVARIGAEREIAFAQALEHQFLRVVPIVAAAALVLAAYNWWGARGTAASPFDAVLNLPQVSLATAYSTSSLLASESNLTELP